MALSTKGFSAVQHGPPLLHLVAMRWCAGSYSSRALRRRPREGGTRSQPHRRDHRQSKRKERRKRGACIDPHGYDAGKKIKGKKRHILVDTLGLLLHAIVHSAGIQDRDGGISLLATMKGLFPLLEKLFADSAYQGPLFANGLANILPHLEMEIVRRSDHAKGFVQLPKRWIVERTIPWLNRCRRLATDCVNFNPSTLTFFNLTPLPLYTLDPHP